VTQDTPPDCIADPPKGYVDKRVWPPCGCTKCRAGLSVKDLIDPRSAELAQKLSEATKAR